MPEDMELQQWLVGLAEALGAANQSEGQKALIDMVGADGNGGIAQVIADYSKENGLSMEAPEIHFLVTEEVDGVPVSKRVGVKIDEHPIVLGVIFGAMLTLSLGISS